MTTAMRVSRHAPSWLRAALVVLLAVVAIGVRTAMPIDETRYLAVAWEMWQRGDFVVPHLNGAAYSHKPPLLFWLIHAGWALTGVNDLWPRLVGPACAIATMLLTSRIARTLWPASPWLAGRAAWILLGSVLFPLFAVMLMFDVLLALCVGIGVLGLAVAAQGRHCGFALLGVGIGLGVLAKGPAVLLHLLPAALLAPWWAGHRDLKWPRWYAGVALAVLGGAAIALAWAIPAGMRGGEGYRDAIFWGQSAHRVVDSFAHRQPIWWYLPWLPLVLAPFLAWRPLWDGLREPGLLRDRGVRLCLALMLPSLAAFSLVSGKQLHYLLPQFPAFALLAARALEQPQPARRPWLAALALAGIGIAVLALGHIKLAAPVAVLREVPAPSALAFFALAAWLASSPRTAADQVSRLAAGAVIGLAAVHLVFVRPLAKAWDLRPLAAEIAKLQSAHRPVAHDGIYHGQYHFAGRLTAPLAEVEERRDALRWLAENPYGVAIVYFKDASALANFTPLAAQAFRSRTVALLDGTQALRGMAASRALEEGRPEPGFTRSERPLP